MGSKDFVKPDNKGEYIVIRNLSMLLFTHVEKLLSTDSFFRARIDLPTSCGCIYTKRTIPFYLKLTEKSARSSEE